MKIKAARRSTIMEKQYRVFVHRDFVKAMGLIGGGEIEWFLTEDGQGGFRKAVRRRGLKKANLQMAR